MLVPNSLFTHELPGLLERFLSITGPEIWNKRFQWLVNEILANRFMEEWLREHHGIALELDAFITGIQRTGEFPSQLRNKDEYNLFAFVAGVVSIHDHLSPSGKARLKGMLLDGLKTDKGLLPLHHEITTGMHLMGRGYDVECHDLERGGGVDYIARKDGIEIEVECKMFTGDLGRKIHRRRCLNLYKTLFPIVQRVATSATRGIGIRITLPSHLTPNLRQHAGIAETLSQGIVGGNKLTRTEYCEVEVKDFLIAESPFTASHPRELKREDVEALAQKLFGNSNPNLMIYFSPKTKAVVAYVESRERDEVLKGMDRQLRESSKGQFTGTRPGILAVQLEDLSSDQMHNLAKSDSTEYESATGLQVMTSWLLSKPNRSHIHSVAYRSHGTLLFGKRPEDGLMESGIAYVIKNPNNLYYNDERCKVFT